MAASAFAPLIRRAHSDNTQKPAGARTDSRSGSPPDLPFFTEMTTHMPPRRILACAAFVGALTLTSACGNKIQSSALDVTTGKQDSQVTTTALPTPSASASPTPSASARPSKSAASSAPTKTSDSPRPRTIENATRSAAPPAPTFPVPVSVGDATQIITVKASGSYATVTAWTKGSTGWKAQFSTSAGRVGANGVTDGATRRQNTDTTPTGTYSITEGFGVKPGGTAMPYTVVTSDDWWDEDPNSKYYNQMHSAKGADFPLTESGEDGSELLINHPVQYAKALVINFNRWPAVPGRGAGIFFHINGSGATAGCVSVPSATMDQVMAWIKPSGHPEIAIG